MWVCLRRVPRDCHNRTGEPGRVGSVGRPLGRPAKPAPRDGQVSNNNNNKINQYPHQVPAASLLSPFDRMPAVYILICKSCTLVPSVLDVLCSSGDSNT